MVRERADLRPVDEEHAEVAAIGAVERGKVIHRRRLSHGIKSLHEFARASGVSRKAITAAELGDASVATYERLEAWLDRFEEEIGDDAPPPSGRLVTFEVEGLFGVARVAVQGPVEDADELQDRFERLLTNLLRQQDSRG